MMNRHQATSQLSELKGHIEDTINEIDEGRYDDDGDLAYWVALAHLMDHLVLAWHYSQMSDERIWNKTQDEFMVLTKSIPKFEPDYQLVELYEQIV